MKQETIDFRTDTLSNNPAGLFLPGFEDHEAKQVALAIVQWARRAGVMFRSGQGAAVRTEYLVVPAAVPAARGTPILTLEQRGNSGPAAKGHLDFPTWRWQATPLAGRVVAQELATRLNAILASDRQVTTADFLAKGDGRYWQNVEYRDIAGERATAAFLDVLEFLRESARAGA